MCLLLSAIFTGQPILEPGTYGCKKGGDLADTYCKLHRYLACLIYIDTETQSSTMVVRETGWHLEAPGVKSFSGRSYSQSGPFFHRSLTAGPFFVSSESAIRPRNKGAEGEEEKKKRKIPQDIPELNLLAWRARGRGRTDSLGPTWALGTLGGKTRESFSDDAGRGRDRREDPGGRDRSYTPPDTVQ